MQVEVCLWLTLENVSLAIGAGDVQEFKVAFAYQKVKYVEEKLGAVDQVGFDQVLLNPAGETLVNEPQLGLRFGGVHRLHVLHARLEAALQVLQDEVGRAGKDAFQVVTSVLAEFQALVADLETRAKFASYFRFAWQNSYLLRQNGQELNEHVGDSFLRVFGEPLNDVGQRVVPRVHEHDEVRQRHADL